MVLLNRVLFRARLVPRLISAWALIAVVPYLVDAALVLFGRIAVSSTEHTLLIAPLALNEMVLAVWLLAKGFAPAATTTVRQENSMTQDIRRRG